MENIECLECANEIELDKDRDYQTGDIIECPHCGTELAIQEVKEDGTFILEIIEEEK